MAKLKILDHDKCNIIRIHGAFFTCGYHCMVFEHLDRSLGDLMRELPFSRLHLIQIRLIVWQVVTTIVCLITINVTETYFNYFPACYSTQGFEWCWTNTY